MIDTPNTPLSNGQAESADVIASMNARRSLFRNALHPTDMQSNAKIARGHSEPAGTSAAQNPPSIWLSIGKSLAGQWWQRHPARIAVRLAESVVEIEAKQHPLRLLAIGAGVGVALVVIAPWRRTALASMLASVLAVNTSSLLSQALSLSNEPQKNADRNSHH